MQVVKMIFGSHLYNTSTPNSDMDYKEVFVPEARDIILNTVRRSTQKNTKNDRERQVNGIIAKNTNEDTDTEYLTLVHFFNMLTNGDPMALDMLYAPDSRILENSAIWEVIRENKDKLICKDISRSMGYCYSQAAKYGIKGSRMSECRALREFFLEETNKRSTAKVREFEETIKTQIVDYQKTRIIDIKQGDGSTLQHLECCSKKISFNVTVKEAYAILDNMFQKFGERTRQAEKNEGVDWKGLSHAVRVGYQTIELLSTGFITFPRPEAEHLINIKTGKLPYKEVAAIIEDNVIKVDEVRAISSLPEYPNEEWMNDFIYNTYREKIINAD